jgi:hypothetical protein
MKKKLYFAIVLIATFLTTSAHIFTADSPEIAALFLTDEEARKCPLFVNVQESELEEFVGQSAIGVYTHLDGFAFILPVNVIPLNLTPKDFEQVFVIVKNYLNEDPTTVSIINQIINDPIFSQRIRLKLKFNKFFFETKKLVATAIILDFLCATENSLLPFILSLRQQSFCSLFCQVSSQQIKQALLRLNHFLSVLAKEPCGPILGDGFITEF